MAALPPTVTPNAVAYPAYQPVPKPNQGGVANPTGQIVSGMKPTPLPPAIPQVDTHPDSRVIGFPKEAFIEEQFISPFPARLVKPEQNQGVFLAGNGDLYEKTRDEDIYTWVGHVNPDGWFTLTYDPKPHFLFHNPLLKFNPYALNGPLARSLQTVYQNMINQSAETQHIRTNLTQRGIDGRGSQIFCIEPGVKDIKGRFKALDHTRLVRATVNDPAYGYAPGASANPAAFLVEEGHLQLDYKTDTPDTAKAKFITDMANSFHRVGALIEAIANQPPVMDPKTGQPQRRVVNMSIGLNPLVTAKIMYLMMESKSPEGKYDFEALRQAFYGPSHKDLKQYEKMNFLIPLAIRWFQSDSRLQEAFQRYQQAVHLATQKNIPVIVAAGNEQNEFPLKTNIPHIARFNWLALPDDVICVAASNNNQTPGVLEDDTISDFSNHGAGVVKRPTIAATGENVVMGKFYTGSADGGAASGTSFAAPIISATVAMLNQVAPGISVSQIRQVLQQSAVRNQTTPDEAGAGIVDPVRAVQVLEQMLAQQQQPQAIIALMGPTMRPLEPAASAQPWSAVA